MSTIWYDAPASSTWQLAWVTFALISGYRSVVIGVQPPNKEPDASTRYKESPYVVFMLVMVPRIIQGYIVLAMAFQIGRVGVAFLSPDVETRICPYRPPVWFILAGIFGTVLGLIGSEMRGWCYRTLGEYFTFRLAVQEKQPLIRTGPYRYLRHPAYFAACIQYVSMYFTLILCNPISMCWGRDLVSYTRQLEAGLMLLFFFAPLMAFVKRVNAEEKMMKAKYGKEYTEWERKTWRLIPFIY